MSALVPSTPEVGLSSGRFHARGSGASDFDASGVARPRVQFGTRPALTLPVLVNCYFQMAISTDLLEILICPACRAKVELKPDGSGLRCVSCHRLYPIRDEIPVMLIDEATIDEQ